MLCLSAAAVKPDREPVANSYCLSGLVAKRAELAGEIRLAEERLDQLRADILHLDAAIRIIAPGYHTDAIVPKARRQRREWFGNGERCWRRCARRPSR
jgi:hypothetical protein